MTKAELAAAFIIARRELRGGFSSFTVFLACLAIGVTAIAAVGIISASVTETVRRDGAALLGGDIAFESAIAPVSKEELRRLLPPGAEVTETLRTNAIVAAGDRHVVVELRAVDERYPLFGDLVLDPAMPTEQALEDGGAVVDPSLLTRIGAQVGDEIRLGDATITIRSTLISEPDRLGGFVSIGPRVLVSIATAQAAGVIEPGSLVRWRTGARIPGLVDPESFTEELGRANPDAFWRVRGSHEVEPQVARFTDRLATYLTMAGLAALLVGGLGVGLAVQSYLAGKTATIATLKSLGASSRLVFAAYLVQVLVLAAIGVTIGLVLGQGIPFLIGRVAQGLVPITIQVSFHAIPLLIAAACGLLTAFVFALWPLALAREVSPAGLFRALVAPTRTIPRRPYLAVLAGGILLLSALAIFGVDRPGLGAIFVAVALASAVVLGVMARHLVTALYHVASRGPVWLRLGAKNLTRPDSGATSVVVALGAGLAVLTTVALLEANLTRELRSRLPERAPSTIFIDIQPDQWLPFQRVIEAEAGGQILQHYPMLRGRVVRIDGNPVDEQSLPENVRWTVRRDRGLTFLAEPTSRDEVVAGSWWPADYQGPPLLSIEDEVAEGYGVGIGDTITFGVLGRQVEARIANIRREIDWSQGRLDFLFILSPGLIDKAPHTVVAAVDLPEAARARVLDTLAEELPNVTPIAINDLVEQVASVLGKIALAIRTVAAVCLVTGILVLAGALNAARRRQRYQSVVLKVLGARRIEVLRLLASEYLAIGIAAAILGAILGTIGAWAIVRFAFGLSWSLALGPIAIPATATLGATLSLGGLAVWRLLGQPAAPVLREP